VRIAISALGVITIYEDLKPGLQRGEALEAGIALVRLPGALVGLKKIAVAWPPRIVFGCRHRENALKQIDIIMEP